MWGQMSFLITDPKIEIVKKIIIDQVPAGSNQCFALESLDYDNQEKVLVVLPKGKFVECEGEGPVYKLQYQLEAGEFLNNSKLVHVRTANGTSINKVVPF